MKHSINLKAISILFTIFFFGFARAQPSHSVQKVSFKTKSGSLTVEKGNIYLNRKLIFKFKEGGIIYNSNLNKLIEDSSSTLLFLTTDGGPNKNRMQAFKIFPNKAVKLVDAIASEVFDFDNDGFLEFGGADLTEVHPNKDSMYYIPTAYYEIKGGTIQFDRALTKYKDIQLNGVYLQQQLDEDGNCCKVIRKPKKSTHK